MNQIRLKAMAKINLGLDVTGRREDGYHEVKMIMQSIYLYDNIVITRKSEPGINLKTNLSFLPVNENNLVYKAAKLMIDTFDIKEGVDIDLDKHIPVAAGMAGGSTDAASVLYGINKMFDLKQSNEKLMELGVKLGADVPYCIMRGTALSEGIGEKLTRLKPVPQCYVLIAKPGISVSTKYVYETLDAKEVIEHPDIDSMISAIDEGDIKKLASLMGNVLETVTEQEYPVITEIKNYMKQNGAINAMMSGSGPTVFGLYEKEEDAVKALKGLRDLGLAKQLFVTDMFNVK